MIRAQLGNAEWLATGYRVHDLEVLATADESRLVGHLGPDLLGPDWDVDEAVRRLGADRERPIADALLDQRNLAGIGNLYKSEVLFIERVNPHRSVANLTNLAEIVSTAHRLLHLNRDRPEQSTTGRLGRGQEHWVYERGGKPCLRCGTPITRELQGETGRERSTYWCQSCQPA
jgi:endonuclease-8